jgi:Zn finger protein HypA/HybF involved in hydrogenase expression
MFTKKELRMAYALAVCLLVVGVASYAAFTPEAPEEPLRLMFKVTAGKVLFDHKTHTSEFGYGLSCVDCHHELEDEEGEDVQSCVECHDPDEGDEEVPKLGDAFHLQCAGCHEEYESGPTEQECAKCHVM